MILVVAITRTGCATATIALLFSWRPLMSSVLCRKIRAPRSGGCLRSFNQRRTQPLSRAGSTVNKRIDRGRDALDGVGHEAKVASHAFDSAIDAQPGACGIWRSPIEPDRDGSRVGAATRDRISHDGAGACVARERTGERHAFAREEIG